MKVTTCPHCHAQTEPGDVYCPSCHRNLAPQPADAKPEDFEPKPTPMKTREVGIFLGVIALIAAGAAVLYARRPAATPEAISEQMTCISSLKAVSNAAAQYRVDNNDVNFPRGNYSLALMPYAPDAGIFTCITTGKTYGVNSQLFGFDFSQISFPAMTAFLFDGTGASVEYPHSGSANVLYADGNAKPEKKGTPFDLISVRNLQT